MGNLCRNKVTIRKKSQQTSQSSLNICPHVPCRVSGATPTFPPRQLGPSKSWNQPLTEQAGLDAVPTHGPVPMTRYACYKVSHLPPAFSRTCFQGFLDERGPS